MMTNKQPVTTLADIEAALHCLRSKLGDIRDTTRQIESTVIGVDGSDITTVDREESSGAIDRILSSIRELQDRAQIINGAVDSLHRVICDGYDEDKEDPVADETSQDLLPSIRRNGRNGRVRSL